MTPVPTRMTTGTVPKLVGRGFVRRPLLAGLPDEYGVLRAWGVKLLPGFDAGRVVAGRAGFAQG